MDTQSDDDFVGLAFPYQDNRNFYLFSWKQNRQTYWRNKPGFLSKAKAGIELKVYKSKVFPAQLKDLENDSLYFQSLSEMRFIYKEPL